MAAHTNKSGRFPRVVEAQDSITRLANTTQYAEGDGISDHATTPTAAGYFTFDMKTKVGAAVRITDITLHKSDHDVTTATFWLLLFTTLPAVAGFADNAQLSITDAEMLECKAVITFPAASFANVVLGDIQTVSPTTPIGIVLAADSSTIYGILVAGAAYTPASGEVITITVKADQES